MRTISCHVMVTAYLKASMISGALYHRVATYSVMIVVCSGVESNPRLKPKSQILSSQSAFTSRLPGFKSLCTTDAEWMYFNPFQTMSISLVGAQPYTDLGGSGKRSTARVRYSAFGPT